MHHSRAGRVGKGALLGLSADTKFRTHLCPRELGFGRSAAARRRREGKRAQDEPSFVAPPPPRGQRRHDSAMYIELLCQAPLPTLRRAPITGNKRTHWVVTCNTQNAHKFSAAYPIADVQL